MNISLPDSLKVFIEKQVKSGRCESPSAYVEALIREDARRQAEVLVLQRINVGEPLPIDEHFATRLAVLLQEAEDSGEPEEMTQEDWESIRRDGMALLQKRPSA
jgi:putative addiction module CopG family antidote